MYDTREKLARDHQWLMSAGLKRAHDEGLAEGIEQGREEGREEGLEIGREVGEWIGTIRTCQAILESPASTDDDLKNTTPDQLKSLAIELQTKVRTRMGKS